VSRVSLHYEEYGEGPCIVLLHGLFGASWHWKKIAQDLSNSYRVLVPDLRNHGRSCCMKEIDYNCMAEDVREFLQQKGIALADVVGHSMGGKVALQLAISYSSLVRKLVIADIAPRSYTPRYKDIIKELWNLVVKNRTAKRRVLVTQNDLYDLVVKSFLQKNFNSHNELEWMMHLPLLIKWYRNILRGIEVPAGFDKPALFIRSAQSGYVSESDVKMIGRLFAHADVITCDRSGHWIHVDEPEMLTKEVRNFLNRPERTGSGTWSDGAGSIPLTENSERQGAKNEEQDKTIRSERRSSSH
jgi:esterase